MRALFAAALVAAFVAAPVSAAPAAAPRDVRLSGRAGDVATFRLDRTTRIGHSATGATITAPGATWSGVAVTRLDVPPHDDVTDTFVHYRLHESLLCPGQLCEPAFQPYATSTDDGRGYAVLRPGLYGVALLGPRGAAVSVALHLVGPRKGRATLRPARAAAYQTTMFDPAVSGAGGDLASRGFARVEPRGRRFVDSIAVAFVLARPSAIQYAICATDGGSRRVDGTGGVAPCADDDGDDHLLGPDQQLVPTPTPGAKAAGVAWLVTAGRVDHDSGLGYEAQVAGVEGRMVALHFAVVF